MLKSMRDGRPKSTKNMKNILILFLIALSLLGQPPKSKGTIKPTAAPYTEKKEDPEARYICRIGSYHNCECMAMVAEVHEEAYRNCQLTSKSDKEYGECVKKVPQSCQIIQQQDNKHPAHSCRRTCKTARCSCDDGPVCNGPEFGYNDYQ